MMTTSNETGFRIFDRSLSSSAGEIDPFDAFSEGTGMLLKAMVDELDTPVSAAVTGRSTALSTSKTIAADTDAPPLWAYIEAAAARRTARTPKATGTIRQKEDPGDPGSVAAEKSLFLGP